MSFTASSSSKRCLFSSEEEADNIDENSTKKKKTIFDDKQHIRFQIEEEFRKINLEIPFDIIDAIDQGPLTRTHSNDIERRKELYCHLSDYLDRRRVRSRGQTYIFPDLMHQLIRCRFPSDIRAYQTVKSAKGRTLVNVLDENKYYVQWKDFCKKICELTFVVNRCLATSLSTVIIVNENKHANVFEHREEYSNKIKF
ncbi:unnamed protein product [Rotaria magnacalcarata]|uniref:Uncharacterized protein n=1 Tax=Rotaria magnacalcarata TaxID=392030 RepID=A0A820DP17_9BILA|nr:unnamed protein product [Rotaria magnacalcarata]CAF4235424.1 unnamed protein product [Rotaria magnacalcarata]